MIHRFAQPEVLSEAEGTNNVTISIAEQFTKTSKFALRTALRCHNSAHLCLDGKYNP